MTKSVAVLWVPTIILEHVFVIIFRMHDEINPVILLYKPRAKIV